MAVKYVSQCFVMHNGTKLEHLKNFKKLDEEFRAEVDLMSGSGTVDKARKYKFSVDYAIPSAGAKLDWSNVSDATFTIELKDGPTIKYSGVDCLTQGEMTIDGNDGAAMTLTFIATGKTIS
jgi:hypothetical protein